MDTFFAGQRFPLLVQYGNLASAHKKAPLASAAVIETRFPRNNRRIAQRPNNEFVPKASVTPLGMDAASPKLHAYR
jgi:hypothetical protein